MEEIYHEILVALASVYMEKDKTKLISDPDYYSNLLIDKFAIHSSSLYFIAGGIIPSNKLHEGKRTMGFDIFTFNSTFRAIIETYLAFHGLFILPKNNDEKIMKFNLWKLEGLISKSQLKFKEEKFNEDLKKDRTVIDELEQTLAKSDFVLSFSKEELAKVYRKGKMHNWKFCVIDGQIRKFDILAFSEYICNSTTIRNLYKLTSMHAHTGFFSIEQFRYIRGKLMNEDYINGYITQAAFLATCMIKDIISIDEKCKAKYDTLSLGTKSKIDRIYSGGINKVDN